MSCEFCRVYADKKRVLFETKLFYIIRDLHPVCWGHLLVISKRHIPDIFCFDEDEQEDFWEALSRARRYCDENFSPDGYNLGANCGEAAGQTVFHFHLHVIPRARGDTANPRGGIRNFKKPLADY